MTRYESCVGAHYFNPATADRFDLRGRQFASIWKQIRLVHLIKQETIIIIKYESLWIKKDKNKFFADSDAKWRRTL